MNSKTEINACCQSPRITPESSPSISSGISFITNPYISLPSVQINDYNNQYELPNIINTQYYNQYTADNINNNYPICCPLSPVSIEDNSLIDSIFNLSDSQNSSLESLI
ncbi:hypothetical protein PIROE2DRAFT_16912 [Piromyces sp. E2]|nr:hypothetical protein PIROE2DRAFT_16912 [Piromyces sp. E2]|eukprot:OUM57942.1 hypothetical protein PIROE2DRAFT_16912 [Piromyces sp. E2]